MSSLVDLAYTTPFVFAGVWFQTLDEIVKSYLILSLRYFLPSSILSVSNVRIGIEKLL
jgi:hypothetical protein